MRDTELKPVDRAMFWIEYVLRHKGAPHLKSSASELTWYEYRNLDVAVFLASVLAIAGTFFLGSIITAVASCVSAGVNN
jgi:hypothetical protein